MTFRVTCHASRNLHVREWRWQDGERKYLHSGDRYLIINIVWKKEVCKVVPILRRSLFLNNSSFNIMDGCIAGAPVEKNKFWSSVNERESGHWSLAKGRPTHWWGMPLGVKFVWQACPQLSFAEMIKQYQFFWSVLDPLNNLLINYLKNGEYWGERFLWRAISSKQSSVWSDSLSADSLVSKFSW